MWPDRLDAARLDELFDHGRFVRHAPAIIDARSNAHSTCLTAGH